MMNISFFLLFIMYVLLTVFWWLAQNNISILFYSILLYEAIRTDSEKER